MIKMAIAITIIIMLSIHTVILYCGFAILKLQCTLFYHVWFMWYQSF